MTDVPQPPESAATAVSTKQRMLAAAMRLFGEQGYAATTIAQIEEEAGLRPGSGGLYRHFPSKRALLDEGIHSTLDARRELFDFFEDPARLSTLSPRERLAEVARAGLARLEHDRDLNRIMVRDLRDFPDLAALVQHAEIDGIRSSLAGWLRSQSTASAMGAGSASDSPADAPIDANEDWDALAAVLMNGVSQFWLLRDSLGTDPDGVTEERFVATLVDLVAARLLADKVRLP